MITELLYGYKDKARIGLVQLDASVEETHVDTAEVSEHPVETGVNVADHVRRLPPSLDIQGVVTNTPVIFLASLQAESPLLGSLKRTSDRVGAAYDELQRIMQDGEAVTVATSLRFYADMILTSLSVARNAQNGNSLNVTMSLKKIIKAETLEVEMATPEDIWNKTSKNKGNTQKKTQPDPPGAETSASVLSKLKDAAVGMAQGVFG
jgi:hypothetical protein